MLTEEGVVETIDGAKARVRVEKSSACAHCGSRDSCDVSAGRAMVIDAANDVDARVGDRVRVSVPEGSFLKLTVMVYLLPVVALIAGAYAGGVVGGYFPADPAAASVMGGMGAVGITFLVLRRLNRSAERSGEYTPRITRVMLRPSSPVSAPPS